MMSYILHVAIILTGCLAFYKVLLQKETFFLLNRFVLLGCLVLSFSLPFAPVPQQWAFRKGEASILNQKFYPVSFAPNQALPTKVEVTKSSIEPIQRSSAVNIESVMTLVVWLYWFGVTAFGINFLLQIVVLLYRAYTKPAIKDGWFRIVELSDNKAPCSFGNIIFINPEKYDWDTYNQILLHEKIHIQQGHSLDIVLAEIALIFQWFNPFAWQYRKELEKNLEFLTDDQLLQHAEVEKTSYQMSLLKVSAPHFPLSLTTNYNQSLLKKRLIMMNAKKSNLHTSWKYFFLLPVLILFVCFFNEPVAVGKVAAAKKLKEMQQNEESEGMWLGTIKDDRLSVKFTDKMGERKSIFTLNEFENLPKEVNISFSTTREAGTLHFTGKFNGEQGTGQYKFIGSKDFNTILRQEGINIIDGSEQMTFFLLDINRSYVNMLKEHGYTQLRKQDLTSLATFGVGKEKGKKLDRDILDVPTPEGEDKDPLDNIINFKAVGIKEEYIKSFEALGYKNISPGTMINFKSTGVTPEYIKSFSDMGYKDIPYGTIINFKSAGVTPEFIKRFNEAGYNDIPYGTIVNLKAAGVTPPNKK